MTPEHSLLAWTALSVALVLTPGPDTMLVAGNAARRGFAAGFAAVGGISTGGLWYMALCGFGFLSVLNAVPELFTIVKTVGALYLAWLGLKLLRGAMRPAPVEAPKLTFGAPFRQGLLTTTLNPKVAVFFLAALPQFAGTGPDAPMLGVLLVAIPYVMGFFYLTTVAAIAARAGAKVGQSGAMRWIEGALGAAFVGFAGKLALTRN